MKPYGLLQVIHAWTRFLFFPRDKLTFSGKRASWSDFSGWTITGISAFTPKFRNGARYCGFVHRIFFFQRESPKSFFKDFPPPDTGGLKQKTVTFAPGISWLFRI